jgi:predicted nucleotidyltransferase
VRIRFLDIGPVMHRLRQAARELKESNPKVNRVLLFGSLVHGDYGPRSDADILVVLESDERRAMDRIPEFSLAFSDVPVGVDIFPLTHVELEEKLCSGNFFWKRALEEGVELA